MAIDALWRLGMGLALDMIDLMKFRTKLAWVLGQGLGPQVLVDQGRLLVIGQGRVKRKYK